MLKHPAVAVIASLLVSMAALAQDQPLLNAQGKTSVIVSSAGTEGFVVPDPNDRLSSISLVLNNSFAQALGLSDQQIEALRQELGKGPLNLMSLTAEQVRSMSGAEITAMHAFQQRKMLGLVDEVLTPEQAARLPQLIYQVEIARIGIGKALTEGRLGKDVGVLENQKENLKNKAARVEAKLNDTIRRAYAEAQADMLGELSAEQRQTAKTLLGESIVFRESVDRVSDFMSKLKKQNSRPENK